MKVKPYDYRDLKAAQRSFDTLKYLVPISTRVLIQMELDCCEQTMQLQRPDQELVRLSATDEPLKGFAWLPVDEKRATVKSSTKLILNK